LLRLSCLVTASPPGADAAAAGNVARVRGFYDAVNATLRTGQSADLERLLAADFLARGGPSGLAPTRAGFIARLLALRATFPAIQLEAHDVFVQGDVVVARVRVEETSSGAFLGLPLAGELSAWGEVDVFRIAAGAIVEHWGGLADAPLLQPLHEVPLDLSPSVLQTIALERITVSPGHLLAFGSVLGPEALYLEGGRVIAAVAEDAAGMALRWHASTAVGTDLRELVAPGSEGELAPGDLLLLSQGSRAAVRNDGNVTATFLAIAVRPPAGPSISGGPVGTESAAASPAATPGVESTDLVGRPLTALPSGPVRLGLGRATLAPGVTLPAAASGVALFAIEAGSSSLANTGGTVWSRRGLDGTITTATDGTLGPGDAVVLEPGSAGEVRSAGATPLVLLVVTITPTNPSPARP
jgi:predicted ester cyclase